MATSVTMPQLGESVTEGTVTRWLKQVGDTVAMDEPLLEVSTDKVDTEIPSPAAGVLTAIRANEDDVVEVGGELAVIGDAAETAAPAPAAPAPEPAPEPVAAAPEPPAAPTPAASSGPGTDVTLPALGESVTEGTVTRWLKQVGDSVAMDEPLLEVSTDKVDTEIPSPAAGVLTAINVNEDETVEVGAVLAVIGGADAPVAAPAPAPAPAPAAAPAPAPAPPHQPLPPAPAQHQHLRLPRHPRRRSLHRHRLQHRPRPQPLRLAARTSTSRRSCASWPRRRVSTWPRVSGTGVGGRIRKQDVMAAATATGRTGSRTGRARGYPRTCPEHRQQRPTCAEPPNR
ncbi:MAG: biotin/lipoyl-containing protein [Candidatus Nanopelagicales bacterium]